MKSKRLMALVSAVVALALCSAESTNTAKVTVADGFDFPVGKPNADGYYIARGLRLREPVHFGEDWNGRNGGDSDYGDPIYATADGLVVWAFNVRVGWGNVVILRHAYRDPQSGQIKYCDSLYGHLSEIQCKLGETVKRGQQIGKMGSNNGMYPAHLHFEIRHNINIGMLRESVSRSMDNWANPSEFINKYRRLSREWRPVAVPIGTCPDYQGCRGL